MAGPLSVEDILAKQKAEREAASKPKFMTKKEREALALEKRNAQIAEVQAKEMRDREEREKFEQAAEEERKKADAAKYGNGGPSNGGRYGHGQQNGDSYGNRGGRYDRNGGGRGGYGGQQGGNFAGQGGRQVPGAPSGPRGSQQSAQGRDGRAPPSGPRALQGHAPAESSPLAQTPGLAGSSQQGDAATIGTESAGPTAAELDSIRARYLGQQDRNKKPKARKIADKKVVFDWNAGDDTSAMEQGTWSQDIIGQGPGGTTFGGRIAGLDEGGSRRGTVSGAEDKHADSLERRRAGRAGIDERHWSDKPLDEMRDRDWRIFREDFSIATKGGSIPHPMRNWQESGIPPQILGVIDEVGYKEPSPIQRQAIPIGMSNRDLIGVAKTGSGKTAAFVIPMLEYISHLPALDDETRHLGPFALILAPTRELAQQIETEANKFCAPLGYKCVSIVGGRSVEEQQYNLRDGAEIVIATPGRLKDMLDRSMLVLSQCRYVVMDEADRMVDLGFEVDLNFILDAMPEDYVKPDHEALNSGGGWKGWRVTTLFSATMPPAVERIARKYLRKPATVTIGQAGEAVDTVEQRVEFVMGDDKKRKRMAEIFMTSGLNPPIIVFVNQKKTADQVLKYVQQAGRSATTLHSGKNQEQREAALAALRDGSVDVLVATDLAGRGIDVPDVSLVLNWQMSDTIEKYVHRIGRTGRAGKTGVAITFLSNDDDEVMFDLKNEVQKSAMSTMNPELARHESARQRITREMKRKREEEE